MNLRTAVYKAVALAEPSYDDFRSASLGLSHYSTGLCRVIQRGNNRQACFYADEDYCFYLEWLREYARLTGCRVHAYVLMTNHVHLFLTPDRVSSPGALMKALGQRYVQYIIVPTNEAEHCGRADSDHV